MHICTYSQLDGIGLTLRVENARRTASAYEIKLSKGDLDSIQLASICTEYYMYIDGLGLSLLLAPARLCTT